MFEDKTIIGLVLDRIDNNVVNGYTLRILTDNGIVFLKAKGIKKVDSKNNLSTQIGQLSEFEILKSKNTYLLKRANLIKDFFTEIRKHNNYMKNYYIFLSHINEKTPNIIEKLKNLYKEINENKKTLFIRNYLLNFLLKSKGIQPTYEFCVECGSNQNLLFFDFQLGGMFCKTHSKIKEMEVKELKSYFYLNKNFDDYYKYSNAEINYKIYEKLINYLKLNT